MDLTSIIAEADVRVPNSFDNAQKVSWLNEINNEFFDAVKIPKTAVFSTVSGTATVTLPTDVRGKNIERVNIGKGVYPSFLYEDVPPGRGYHTFDDVGKILTIVPTPTAVLSGIVKYYQISTTTFISTTLTAIPDAPAEYHWVYILGLCERIANALDDIPRASNYGQQYRGQLAMAQANYAGGGPKK